MISQKPGDTKESYLESLYEDFLQIDIPYESKKCKRFVKTS